MVMLAYGGIRYGGVCECGDHAWARLTHGHVTLVSPCDAHLISSDAWHAHPENGGKVTYAYRNKGNGRRVVLHREILSIPAGFFVDHINHWGTDNRRTQIRVATNAQNQANRKIVPSGADYCPSGRWRARVEVCGRTKHLGMFDTKEEAQAARDRFVKERHGDFAKIRRPA